MLELELENELGLELQAHVHAAGVDVVVAMEKNEADLPPVGHLLFAEDDPHSSAYQQY